MCVRPMGKHKSRLPSPMADFRLDKTGGDSRDSEILQTSRETAKKKKNK